MDIFNSEREYQPAIYIRSIINYCPWILSRKWKRFVKFIWVLPPLYILPRELSFQMESKTGGDRSNIINMLLMLLDYRQGVVW